MNKEGRTSKLKRKLHIAIFTEKSYEQIFSIKISPITAFISIGFLAILLIAGVIMLVAFTGLREYIPGYPTGEERRLIMSNMQRADSLLFEINKRDRMITDMRNVISGDLPLEAYSQDSMMAISRRNNEKIDFTKSKADSLFRIQIEAEEDFNVSASKEINPEVEYLYTPIKGILTNKFDEGIGHFGVDIAGREGTRISSVLGGTVIFAEWTVETGFVIQIQHENQMVSIYKHNSKLLKKVGARVVAGEAIALMGNSGELTTGPHLHFELWQSGVPLNPENYVSFE